MSINVYEFPSFVYGCYKKGRKLWCYSCYVNYICLSRYIFFSWCTQPPKVLEMQLPDILLPSIKIFFQSSCGLSEDGVEMCWDLLKGMIWGRQGSLCSDCALDGLFWAHGNHLGFSSSHCSLPGFLYLIISIYLYLPCSFEYNLSPPAFLLSVGHG